MAFILDGTTGIATVDGSVSAPSQRGQDNNSGISYGADSIKFSTNGVERMAITNSGVTGTGIGAGKILQVVSTTYQDQTTFNSETPTIISGMTRTIQPIAANSKIFIDVDVNCSISQDGFTSYIYLYRGGSVISGATGNNAPTTTQARAFKSVRAYALNVPNTMSGTYLDTPSYTLGDTLTYHVYFSQEGGSTAHINYMSTNSNVAYYPKVVSTHTLFEVGA